MAELPTYKSVGITYGELPKISTADIELKAKGWGTISEKLDLLGKAVQTKVEERIGQEAQQYAIENPITYEQLQDAIAGKQSIQSLAPEGAGSIYRKALFEAQGVMLSQDLRMMGLREFSDLKNRAKKGEISPEDVYQRTKDIRDGYVATLRSLDPESAKNLGTVLTTKANVVYEDALEFEVKQANLNRQLFYANAVEDNRSFVRSAFLSPKYDPQNGVINPELLIETYRGDISGSQLELGTNKYIESFNKMVQEERLNALKDIASDKEKFVSPSAFKTSMQSKKLGYYQFAYDGLSEEQKSDFDKHLSIMIGVEKKEVSGQLSDMNSILTGGGIVREDDILAMKGKVEALGQDAGDLPEKFNSFLYSHAIMTKWIGLPPEVIRSEIENMRSGLDGQGGEGVDTQLEVDAIKTAESLHKNMVAGLDKDAISFASKNNLIEIDPIDFSSPDMIGAAVQKRIVQSDEVLGIYGRSNLLTESERSQFKSLYDQQDRVGKLVLLGSINDNFGSMAGDAIAELAPKDPQLAHIGGLVTIGANETANTALKGQEYIALGQKPADLTPQNLQPEFVKTVGSAFINNQESRGTTLEVAKAIYTAKAIDQGVDIFDANLWKSSIQEAVGYDPVTEMGGIQSVRDQQVVLPRTLNAEEFEHILDNLTPENLMRASNQQVDERMLEQVRDDDDWYPIVDYDGQYFFAKGTPGSADFRWLADVNNQPVKINMDDRSWYQEPVQAEVIVSDTIMMAP